MPAGVPANRPKNRSRHNRPDFLSLLKRLWPVLVGVALIVAATALVLSVKTSNRQVENVTTQKDLVVQQRDATAGQAKTLASQISEACADSDAKSSLPSGLCSQAERVKIAPIPGIPGATGPQGVPGEPGIAGTPGEPGTAGTPGEPGTAGAQGIQGVQGPQGVQGAQGDTGPPGAQGPAGAPGQPPAEFIFPSSSPLENIRCTRSNADDSFPTYTCVSETA